MAEKNISKIAHPDRQGIREGIEKGGTNARPSTPRPTTPPGATAPKGPTNADSKQK